MSRGGWVRGACPECGLLSEGKGDLRCDWCRTSQPRIVEVEPALDLEAQHRPGRLLLDGAGWALLSVCCVAFLCFALVVIVGCTLAIDFALSTLMGGELYWETMGGMPGTGDPLPVFVAIGFVTGVTVVGKVGARFGWVVDKLAGKPSRLADLNRERRITAPMQDQVIELCLRSRVEMDREIGRRRHDLLKQSATEALTVVGGRREWIVQVRERPSHPDARRRPPFVLERVSDHLDRVLAVLDERPV